MFRYLLSSGKIFLVFTLLAVVALNTLSAQEIESVSDTLIKNQNRNDQKKIYRETWRKNIHKTHDRFFLGGNYTFSNLLTTLSFKPPEDYVTVTLRMESDLKLQEKDEFFSTNFLGRLTPRSSIYVLYYGINRRSNFIADEDYVFQNDTLKEGTNISPFFNTQVLSMGYMFSAMKEANAFLGFYFNLYLLFLETGIDSNLRNINTEIRLGVPLPNMGFIANYHLLPWLRFKARAGFFSLRIEDFGGRLYDFNIGFAFQFVDWLSLGISYQEFDIVVDFIEKDLENTVRYNFRGPSIGINISY